MKTFGLVGWSGSGKTTLLVRLLPELISRGLSVSTMKHTHHHFDIDKPGKDSYEHRAAGAKEVMVISSRRWALMHELRGQPEPDMEDMIQQMTPVDLLLIEGFKSHRHAKLEVYRPSVGKPLLCASDPTVVAVASDEAIPGLDVPRLDLDDVAAVADFIVDQCGLAAAAEGADADDAA
ncbi:MAG: molybdopterin-guanine dinucleotide biosynthesis protein B [Hyphomicrobiales bacterium]|nr:molybdopterin-guanine dinucleotide biosynthesis protein B [Hyphomicrobiales bacterium]MCP5372308.1 molybdopterin-guanine dinucleotide biosynthesis protein B [Hyphomicrobiales bacterium]